jgi:hypothetical protein
MHRRTTATLFAVGALAASLALAPTAQAGGQPFTTALEGENEVPIGDLDGTGTATITINRGTGDVCWEIMVAGITLPSTGAHIHEAPVGSAGDIVVPLSAPDATGFADGCTTVTRELAKDIAKNPEDYYVNVHNADHPLGALRGQLG